MKYERMTNKEICPEIHEIRQYIGKKLDINADDLEDIISLIEVRKKSPRIRISKEEVSNRECRSLKLKIGSIKKVDRSIIV